MVRRGADWLRAGRRRPIVGWSAGTTCRGRGGVAGTGTGAGAELLGVGGGAAKGEMPKSAAWWEVIDPLPRWVG